MKKSRDSREEGIGHFQGKQEFSIFIVLLSKYLLALYEDNVFLKVSSTDDQIFPIRVMLEIFFEKDKDFHHFWVDFKMIDDSACYLFICMRFLVRYHRGPKKLEQMEEKRTS